MRIVYFYPDFKEFGGTQRVLVDKMNYLADCYSEEVILLTYSQGVSPIIYTLSPKVKHFDLEMDYIPLYRYNRFFRFFKMLKYDFFLKKRFNTLMGKLKPDVVITTTYFYNLVSIVASCSIPYVRIMESHIGIRYLFSNSKESRKYIWKWMYESYKLNVITRKARKYDMLVALNQTDANDWRKYVKTRVIKNVVHPNLMRKMSDLQSKRIVFVGRLVEQKGVFDLLEIWKKVHQKHPDWYLDIYGDGELRKKLEKIIKSLKIGICLHSPVFDIFKRYAESSMLLLTSLYEPFGLVMPEAMSCGLPVVAFDCPDGPSLFIKDGKNGFLVKNRDVSAFSDRVCRLIDSIKLRRRMGNDALKSSANYAPEQIMPQWICLFKELLENRQQ